MLIFQTDERNGLIMKLEKVKEVLNAKVFTGENKLSETVNSACGCDLMSDVLAFVKDQAMLLTGLVNPQVIRTAEMMDMKCIVFVRGKEPDETLIQMAKEKNIVLMSTQYPLYVACGRLYSRGLNPEGIEIDG